MPDPREATRARIDAWLKLWDARRAEGVLPNWLLENRRAYARCMPPPTSPTGWERFAPLRPPPDQVRGCV